MILAVNKLGTDEGTSDGTCDGGWDDVSEDGNPDGLKLNIAEGANDGLVEEDLVVLFIFMTCLKSTDVGMYEGIVDGASDSKGDSVGGVDGWTGRGTGA